MPKPTMLEDYKDEEYNSSMNFVAKISFLFLIFAFLMPVLCRALKGRFPFTAQIARKE